MDGSLQEKLQVLRGIVAAFPSALVAYSGGVDSTLIAHLACEALGERMKAVTVDSPLLPPRELDRARNIAAYLRFPVETVSVDELSAPGFDRNPPDRCYICKKLRLGMLLRVSEREGWEVVLEGSNLDDAGAHRPGRRASMESGARSPLEEARFTKEEVRTLARELGLPNWDAPSRPCLATRFPYGMLLQAELLRRVDAAEEALEGMGLRQLRVRLESQDAARVEVDGAGMALLDGKDNRDRLVKKLRGLGFRRIELDLEGYRSGSMDEGRPAVNCRVLYSADEEGLMAGDR